MTVRFCFHRKDIHFPDLIIGDRNAAYRHTIAVDHDRAAGLEVLQILRRENLVERAANVGALLGQKLHATFDGHPSVIEVRGRGMFYGIEITCSRDAVVMAALDRDLWVYPAGSGPVAEAVMVAPQFGVSETELDQLVGTLRDSLDAVAGG